MARDSDRGKREAAKVYDSANRRAQRRKEGMRTEDRSQREAGVARIYLCSPLPVPACQFARSSHVADQAACGQRPILYGVARTSLWGEAGRYGMIAPVTSRPAVRSPSGSKNST